MKKIRIGGVNEHFNLPWIKASELNNFSCHLEWKVFEGGTGVLTSALRNEEIDLAILLTEGLIIDIIKKKELQLVNFHVNNPLRWAIHIRKEDENDFDFRGKRIAISRIGSGSHTMAKYHLVNNKIDWNEVSFVEVGSLEGGLKALKNKEADIFLWEKFTTEPFLEVNGLIALDEVRTPWPPFSIATTKKFAKEHTELIMELLSHIQQVKAEINNEDTLVKELLQRWKISKENALKWIAEIKWHDYSTIEISKTNAILSEMKKVNLLNETDKLLDVDIFGT